MFFLMRMCSRRHVYTHAKRRSCILFFSQTRFYGVVGHVRCDALDGLKDKKKVADGARTAKTKGRVPMDGNKAYGGPRR